MIVYMDLIFLMNFLLDGAMLYLAARTRKLSVNWWRILLSAGMGASYVVMMFFPSLSFLFTFSLKCIFCIVMIWTAYGFGSLQNFLRNLGTFYLINFAAAGGIFGLHYVLQSSSEVMNGILFTHSGGLLFQMKIRMGFFLILFLVLIMLLFFRSVFNSTKQREEMTTFLADVKIEIDGFCSCCTGLIDTGNQLFDPLTRTPVMIIEASQWKEILPVSWMKRIQEAEVDQIISSIGTDLETEEFIWQDRLRLVPYRGVNRKTQFMLAIKPDKVIISHQDKRMETTKVLIGLDGGKLCNDGSYHAIIHPTLISAS